MKKLIVFLIAFLIAGASFSQSTNIFKYIINPRGGINITPPLKINGHSVTATATEINKVIGIDTTQSIQTQITSKLSISDSLNMLSKYARKASPTLTGTVSLPGATSIGNVSSTEIGYVDGVSGAIQTQLNGKQSSLGIFNVLDYGAVGDGVTDDVLVLQAAFNAAAIVGGTITLSHKTYLFTSTLYIYGNVNIIDGTLKPRMTVFSGCSVAMGAKSGDVTGNYVWSGRIENVTFDCDQTYNDGYIINILRGSNYAIKNCTFLEPYFTAIKGMNNGVYAQDYLVRENGLYENNYIYSTGIGVSLSEGMSIDITSTNHTYPVKNMRFINNIIIGITDDPIAIHGEIDNIIIDNNICISKQGRIVVHDCRNAIVSNNILQHTTDAGWFIDADFEIEGSNQPENISIINNKIITPSTGGAQGGYLIRAFGVKNLIIDGNELINNMPDLPLLTAIEIADLTTGLSKKTKVTNNKIKNGTIKMYSLTDTSYVVMNNVIDSGFVYMRRPGNVKNNFIIPHTDYDYIYLETFGDISETKIAEFKVTLPENSNFDMTLLNGLTGYLIPKNFQITHYRCSLSATYSSGYITLTANINGGQKMAIGEDYHHQYWDLVQNSPSILVKEGDLLTVIGSTTSGTGMGTKILTVEIFGAFASN